MNIVAKQIPDPDGIALIIFSSETDIRWLRILKRGFRHCFACIRTHGQWIFYDPLAHTTCLSVCSGMDSIDLEFWFRQQGFRVMRTKIQPAPQEKLSPALFTCVEAVKRILGIRSLLILTPWQLYKHLNTASEREK